MRKENPMNATRNHCVAEKAETITVRLSPRASARGAADECLRVAAGAFHSFIAELRKREVLDAETLTDIDYIITDYLCHSSTSFIDAIIGES